MMRSFLILSLLMMTSFVLLQAQIPENPEDVSPLLVGEIFPDLPVVNTKEKTINFHQVLQEKPTVLIFYRGGWCPFCNDHLREIGQKETDILALGYQIVAVSPDKVEKLKDIEQMDDINYRLFSDSAGQLTRAAGIAFKAPERYTQRLLDWSDGKNTGFLPVPSLFVLDQKGEIQFEYINPNYKKRMSGELLLAVLKVLKEEGEE